MQEQDNAEKLTQTISYIVQFMGKIRDEELDEAATKQFIILPILRALGWDVENLDTLEVFPESRTERENGEQTKVDYALRHKGQVFVLIECKRWGDNLENQRNLKQLAGYIFQRGIDLGVLTDGRRWDFYFAYKTDVLWPDRKFCTIELDKQVNKQKDTVADFQKYLSKFNVINGKAKAEAEKIVQTYAERADIQRGDRRLLTTGDRETRRMENS